MSTPDGLGPGSVHEQLCALLLVDPDQLLAELAGGIDDIRRQQLLVRLGYGLLRLLAKTDPPTATMPALPAVPTLFAAGRSA